MIDLTPLDVRNKRGDFKKIMRGYDPQEVDVFLELAAERLEALVRENLQLRERTQTLQTQVDAQVGREQAVQDALVTAQELRADIQEQSQREADHIRREAEVEARQKVADAEAEVRKLLAEADAEVRDRLRGIQRRLDQSRHAVEELERRRVRFLREFRALLVRELDVVQVEEERAPFEERAIDLDLGPRPSASQPDASTEAAEPEPATEPASAPVETDGPAAAPAQPEGPASAAAIEGEGRSEASTEAETRGENEPEASADAATSTPSSTAGADHSAESPVMDPPADGSDATATGEETAAEQRLESLDTVEAGGSATPEATGDPLSGDKERVPVVNPPSSGRPTAPPADVDDAPSALEVELMASNSGGSDAVDTEDGDGFPEVPDLETLLAEAGAGEIGPPPSKEKIAPPPPAQGPKDDLLLFDPNDPDHDR